MGRGSGRGGGDAAWGMSADRVGAISPVSGCGFESYDGSATSISMASVQLEL